jgi:1-acyl-sn-glycerol-3-phosphate acyltransferase
MLRSALYNLVMWLSVPIYAPLMLFTAPLPLVWRYRLISAWARFHIWLARAWLGIDYHIEGREHLPQGAAIIMAKHQSTWETFALLSLFKHPIFIIKRELTWIPLFGWFTIKGKMIAVDRGAGSQALAAMTKRAREVIRGGRQLFIFPEGTRRAAGAEPRYKFGVAHLYDVIGVPCVPVALNSGLFWPRRSLIRLPGTIVVEFLEPIPPGLDKDAFFSRMQDEIETATARLVAEGEAELKRRGLRADP